MSNHQLFPLETNPQTGEPFLRLRNHRNIILTPPRWSDAPYISPILNDDAVHPWLRGPPYPHQLEHAEAIIKKMKPPCDEVLADLEAARDQEEQKVVRDCPVKFLREVREDGTDMFIGDISIKRSKDGELMGANGVDWESKEKNEKDNELRKPGDPEIVWSIGDFLAPSHHRQGIMTDAVATLLHDWAVPRMNVKRIVTSMVAGNDGSLKVFTKNGFKVTETYSYEIKGRIETLQVIEWKLNEISSKMNAIDILHSNQLEMERG